MKDFMYNKMNFFLGFYTRPQIPDNKVGCGKCGYGKKDFSFEIRRSISLV
jgi:hypothetical protein